MKKAIVFLIAPFFLSLGSCNNQGSEDHDGGHNGMGHGEDVTAEAGFPSDEEMFSLASNARVFFANLNDGDEVSSPLKIEFGLEGMMIEPAGEPKVGYGHHHIFVNRDFWPEKEVIPNDPIEDPIPNDAVYTIHYGQGQTETELNLSPGKYTLTMQFADGFHRSYGEQMAASISIVVK